jgi:alcohol dehydrogenase class IV
MCMLASHLSQSTNVLGGFTHACCHVLGARLGAPHGVLNGIMLPRVVELLEGEPARRAEFLARSAGLDAMAPALDRLLETLELPQRLRDVGLERDGIPAIADEILGDFSFAQSGGIDWTGRVYDVLERAW